MANDADTSVGQSPSGDLAPARGRIPAGAPTLDFSGRRVLIAGGSKGVARKWWNIGVRIEDDVLVTRDGYDVLSKNVPKSVDEIEALMV